MGFKITRIHNSNNYFNNILDRSNKIKFCSLLTGSELYYQPGQGITITELAGPGGGYPGLYLDRNGTQYLLLTLDTTGDERCRIETNRLLKEMNNTIKGTKELFD